MRRLCRRKQNDYHSDVPNISLTPLIDTVLVLLVIFMVTTPSKVVLPGQTKEARDSASAIKNEDYVVVCVTLDNGGNIAIDGKPVSKNFEKHLTEAFEKSPIKTVFVKADPDSSSHVLHGLFDKIRRIHGVRIILG